MGGDVAAPPPTITTGGVMLIKAGIDYFPLDVNMDGKIALIEAEYGLTGFAVVVKLFQRIYSGHGYYCEWTTEVALLFSKSVGMGGNVVSEIVGATISRGMFDEKLFEKYQILTSKGIQTRYFDAAKRRKKVEIEKPYLLVSDDEIPDNVYINSKNVSNNSKNVDKSTQSKEKESKEKESKVIRIVEYLNEKTGKSFKPTTKATVSHINARLNEGFTYEDFKRVIDNRISLWLNDPKMSEYLRPETLFGTKFESYLQSSKKETSWQQAIESTVETDYQRRQRMQGNL